MKRLALLSVVLGLGLTTPVSASTRTYFGFEIGIGNAPPPPVVVFHEAPDFVFVPSARVYVVRSHYGYDMFRQGRYYYLCDDGYWYRARSYRGPFRVIDVRYVPRSVFYVPDRHWKHHWQRDGRHSRHEVAERRYRDDDHDRKHGNGHGHHDDQD